MRVLLRDLSPGQQYAIQFRSNDGAGNTSDWSQVQRFTTTNDTVSPANITNLSWFDSGPSFIAQWDKVNTNIDGSTLKDFRAYHVVVTNGTTSQDFYVVQERFEFTQAQNIAQFGTFQSSITIKVTAVDLTWNESPVPTTKLATPQLPPVPSLPSISNYLGLLAVAWDGKTSGAAAMPGNFAYCEVHVSTTSGFTPSASTLNTRVLQSDGSAKTIISGLAYNTTYYVRLIAVNSLGLKSAASAQASGKPASITGLDIANGQISTAQINFSARDIGGANSYYSPSQPVVGTNGVTTLKSGDLWFDNDDRYTVYRYNGTTWVAAPEVGIIAGTKIMTGTLTSDAVGTNLLITSSANIGNAVIDSAHIQSLDGGLITAGVIQSTARVTVNGASVPAWKLDVAGNATFNNANIMGLLTTGTTGQRVEIGQTGNVGAVVFHSPKASGMDSTGSIKYLSLAADPTSYRLRIGGDVSAADNPFAYSLNFGAGNASLRANYIGFYADRGTIDFNWVSPSDPSTGLGNGTPYKTMSVGDGLTVLPQTGRYNEPGFQIGYQGDVPLASAPAGTIFTGAAFNVIGDYGNKYNSARIQLMNSNDSGPEGIIIKMFHDPASGNPLAMEIRDAPDLNFVAIRASAFTVISDARTKTEIDSIETSDMLNDVMSLKVKKYRRIDGSGTAGDQEIGFIAQEMPRQLVAGNPTEEAMHSVDLYQTVAALTGALQQTVTELRELKKELGK